ncbi:MAG: hypothetical protein ACR2PF_18140, partial [Rhizobiaceae bacterium]
TMLNPSNETPQIQSCRSTKQLVKNGVARPTSLPACRQFVGISVTSERSIKSKGPRQEQCLQVGGIACLGIAVFLHVTFYALSDDQERARGVCRVLNFEN